MSQNDKFWKNPRVYIYLVIVLAVALLLSVLK